MRSRLLVAAAAATLAAATLVSAAPAQAPSKASAAVVSGSLGRVARVRASGGDSTSRTIPAQPPDGIVLGDGFVSVSTPSGAGESIAQAEADDLELFGGAVTASLVSRTATATAKGVKYRGSVRDLVLGEREIGSVEGAKTYTFDAGKVVVNRGGAGLDVTLTEDLNGFPAGTHVVVADVSASAGEAHAGADRDAHRDRDPEGHRDADADPVRDAEAARQEEAAELQGSG